MRRLETLWDSELRDAARQLASADPASAGFRFGGFGLADALAEGVG